MSPRNPPVFVSQCWDNKYVPLHLAFYMGIVDQTQVLMFTYSMHSTYWARSPAPFDPEILKMFEFCEPKMRTFL